MVLLSKAAPALQRRGDTCRIDALDTKTLSISGGVGNSIPSTSLSEGLSVKCTNGKFWSTDNVPNPQTIKASETGLDKDINWNLDLDLSGFTSCSASYGNGPQVSGTIDDQDIQSGVDTFGYRAMSSLNSATDDMTELLERLKLLSPTIDLIRTKSGAAGLSLGVLHHGEVIHTAHFGLKDVSAQLPPDDDTVYYMASLTKAITCVAMAAVVDKGQLKWDTPVSQILPDFAQRKDAVGRNGTIIDILAHRTGLAGANALWAQRN
ncbi:MAG: hypothetical protein Q9221_000746 [Calogaya cf. arnoldii]